MANEPELKARVTIEDEGSGVLQQIGQHASGLVDVLKTGLGVAVGNALTGGFGALKDQLGSFIDAAQDAEKTSAQLDAVLKSTHGASGMTAESVNQLATSLSQMTPFEDDAIVGADNMLLTFTNIGKDVFPQATETVLNMSQALGQDLKSSAIQLGKALNDPITGASALQRVGVTFNETQKETIKKLVESGDVMGAQKVILKELETEFGGAAKAAGGTFAGQMTILENSIGNIKESIGGALLPVLTQLAQGLSSALNSPEVQAGLQQFAVWLPAAITQLVGVVQTNWPTIQATLMQVWAVVQPILQTLLGFLQQLFNQAPETASGMQSAFGQIQEVVASVWSVVGPILQAIFTTLAQFWTEIQPKLAAAWSAISIKIQEVTTFIGNFIRDHWDQIKGVLEGVWQAIQAAVQVAWSLISGIIKVALDLISGDFDAAGADLKTMAQGIWEGLKVIFSLAWAALQQIVREALLALLPIVNEKMMELHAAIQNKWQEILDWLGGLPSRLQETARDILAGLIRGFWDKAGEIRAALSDIINQAIDHLKDLLGIHSPSTVFAGIGANLAQGLAAGFGRPNLSASLSSTTYSAGLALAGASAPRGGGGTIQVTLQYAPLMSLADRYEAETKLVPLIEQALRRLPGVSLP